MASNTLTIQNSISWAYHFLGRRPFAGLDAAYPFEPALTTANVVIQTMLQPPFKWRWNRASNTFAITPAGGGADVVVAIPNFGFIEKAQIAPTSGVNQGQVIEIPDIKTELAQDGQTGRPSAIAAYLDDNNGNISFRFMPGTPDQNYNVTVLYQKSPALLANLTTPWPIPDRYSNVYNNGFLFYFLLYAGDARAFAIGQKFASNLLALSEGLNEQEKAIFLGEWDVLLQQSARGQYRQQLANDGRTR